MEVTTESPPPCSPSPARAKGDLQMTRLAHTEEDLSKASPAQVSGPRPPERHRMGWGGRENLLSLTRCPGRGSSIPCRPLSIWAQFGARLPTLRDSRWHQAPQAPSRRPSAASGCRVKGEARRVAISLSWASRPCLALPLFPHTTTVFKSR